MAPVKSGILVPPSATMGGDNSHKNGTDKTFAQMAMEVLQWEQENFQGQSFRESDAFGKEEIAKNFRDVGDGDYDANMLTWIILLLASRMNTEDAAQLRATLAQKAGSIPASSTPTDADSSPLGVFKKVLGGGYGKKIDDSEVAFRRDISILALYFYMNLFEHSEEEMTEILSTLITTFDDPQKSLYGYGVEGLTAAPLLADLCKKSIERHRLRERVRSLVKERVKALPHEMARAIARGSAWSAGVNWEEPTE